MTTKKELDGWAEEAMGILEEHGYLKQNKSTTSINWIMPLVFFIVGMLFLGALIYGINNDAFKSEFNQEIDPNISVNNQYDFNPSTENEYEIVNNHTIINNVIIPSDLCGGPY